MKIKKICLGCKEPYIAQRKRRKYCTLQCANIHKSRPQRKIYYCSSCKGLKSRRAKRCFKCEVKYRHEHPEIRRRTAIKIGKTLHERFGNHNVDKICKFCKNNFIVSYVDRDHDFCNNSCASKYKWLNYEYAQKISNAMKLRIKLGLQKGFPKQYKNYKSNAEKFVIIFLDKHNIKYEFNKRSGKYTIDFAMENKKIALEIDGRLHAKRKDLDARKDYFLRKNSWKVYRIPWVKLTDIEKNIKLNKFLKFYYTFNRG